MNVKYIPVRLLFHENKFTFYPTLWRQNRILKNQNLLFDWPFWTSDMVWYKLFLYIFYSSICSLLPWEVFALHCMFRTLHISEIIWLAIRVNFHFLDHLKGSTKKYTVYMYIFIASVQVNFVSRSIIFCVNETLKP